MTPHIRHIWTSTERTRAVELYREHGPSKAARILSAEISYSVNKRTVQRWAVKAGVESQAPDAMAAAHAAAEAKKAALRAELNILLLETTVKLIKRIDEPHIEFKGANAHQVEYPVAPAASCASYAVAIGTFIDKYRLENGEVTGREEVITVDKIDREIAKLNEELARRGALDS